MFLIKFFLPLLLLLSACNMSNPIPTPEKIPYTLSQNGDQRIDNYYWIRDDSRKNKKMLSYLKSENDYADYWFSTKNDYQTELVNQLMSQVPEKEVSFKIANNDFKYYEITTKSEQLPKYFRSDKDNNEVFIFNGWTFSSSPAVNPFDHAVYDIWLTRCY